MVTSERMPWWAWTWPGLAWAALGLTLFVGAAGWVAGVTAFVLIATVFAAVYHAEVVAHRVGEPFGTLVLALAVTVIEVALIVSVMIEGGPEKAGLARDTVFSAVMIVCNGIVGLCLLAGGVRHREQDFRLEGALAALAVLAALTVLTLVVPNVTTSVSGPVLSTAQLAFAGVASLVLYGSFVFVQTVRHRTTSCPRRPAARRPTPNRRPVGRRSSRPRCSSPPSSSSSASPRRSRRRSRRAWTGSARRRLSSAS